MKKVLKKVVEYFRKNWRLGKASTVTMVLAISMMSCSKDEIPTEEEPIGTVVLKSYSEVFDSVDCYFNEAVIKYEGVDLNMNRILDEYEVVSESEVCVSVSEIGINFYTDTLTLVENGRVIPNSKVTVEKRDYWSENEQQYVYNARITFSDGTWRELRILNENANQVQIGVKSTGEIFGTYIKNWNDYSGEVMTRFQLKDFNGKVKTYFVVNTLEL